MKKMYFQSAFAIVLIACLCGCTRVPSSQAATEPVNVHSSSLSSNTVWSEGIPLTDTDFSFDMRTEGASPQVPFRISSDHQTLEIQLMNHAKFSTTASLQYRDHSQEIKLWTIKGGQKLHWNSNTEFPKGLPTGDYIIQYRADGRNVSMDTKGVIRKDQ